MPFVKQVSELKLLHHDQSPPDSVIIISFFLFQIWQIYQKLLDLIKIVPSFPSQIFPLLWSTMHLFTMIFLYLSECITVVILKRRKDDLMDIVCSVASPNIALVFIYISSHLLFVVSFRYANGLKKTALFRIKCSLLWNFITTENNLAQ